MKSGPTRLRPPSEPFAAEREPVREIDEALVLDLELADDGREAVVAAREIGARVMHAVRLRPRRGAARREVAVAERAQRFPDALAGRVEVLVDERPGERARRRELRHQRAGRELERAQAVRATGEVGAAAGVHRDVVRDVVARAADVGGVDRGGAGRIELRDESVAAEFRVGAPEARLESPQGRRKVGRERRARHVGIAARVHGNCCAPVGIGAAEESGVRERRAGGIELRDERVAGSAAALIAPIRLVTGSLRQARKA